MNDPTPPQTTPADPTAPDTNAPMAPGGPATAVPAQPGTALQIAEMLAAGKIDATQAAKLAKAGGFTALQVAQSLHIMRKAGESQPEARSPESIKLDQEFGPPAKESDFNPIPYYLPGQAPAVLPKEVVAFDQSAKAWMGPTGAGLSVEAGNSLVTHIAHALQETQHMSPDELVTYAGTEHLKLQRAHGEKLPERLALADDMIDAIERQRPGLLQLLETKGIGRNALVWNLLIQAATGFHARKGQGR